MQGDIYRLLKVRHSWMDSEQIGSALNMKRNLVTRKLRALEKSGMVKRQPFINPRGHYQLRFLARRR